MRGDQERSGPRFERGFGARVTQLELFYDLVFVFAFLNVTTTSAKYFGALALLASFLLLALLWSAWSSFGILGNTVRIDQGLLPLFGFATMAAILIAAVAIPEAFTDRPPGPPGDLVFATAYLAVHVLQLSAFWYATRGDPSLTRSLGRLAAPPLVATALLFGAAAVRGDGVVATTVRHGLWVLAVLVVYGAGLLRPAADQAVVSGAAHWADRHAQIILIALGESVIALGVGPGLRAGLPITWPVLGTVALGIALLAALWWAYFDVRAFAAEQALHRARGRQRRDLARDAYTYLHLVMIFGIILLSLGIKRLLAAITHPPTAGTRVVAHGLDPYVLYGGVVVYLVAVLAFQVRTVHRLSRYSVLVIVVLAGLMAIGDRLPALVALAVLAGTVVLATTGQSFRTRNQRRELRRQYLAEQRALARAEVELREDGEGQP